MSVINTTSDVKIFGLQNSECNICDEKLWPPFVMWNGKTNHIFICRECCNIKEALMADLVQAAAIAEINRLGYGDITLVRKSRKEVEETASSKLGYQTFADLRHARMKGDDL